MSLPYHHPPFALVPKVFHVRKEFWNKGEGVDDDMDEQTIIKVSSFTKQAIAALIILIPASNCNNFTTNYKYNSTNVNVNVTPIIRVIIIVATFLLSAPKININIKLH